MMVFRRKGRTFFEAKVPRRDGTWSKEPTGTNDRVTAKAIDHMLDVLRRKRSGRSSSGDAAAAPVDAAGAVSPMAGDAA
jgi:hypothetical protein